MTKTYNDIDAVTRLLEEVILLLFKCANCSKAGSHVIGLIDLISSRNCLVSIVISSTDTFAATDCSDASTLSVSPLLPRPTERARSGVGCQNRPVAAQEEQNSDRAK